MTIKVTLGAESQSFETQEEAIVYADELHTRLGGIPQFETVLVTSDFGEGNQVIDQNAKTRIEVLHNKLNTAGIKVDAGEQLFETGTRLAQVGYDNQASRKIEHDQKATVIETTAKLRKIVQAEGREDRIITAGEFAKSVDVNGFAKALDLKLTEQAIRGLMTRTGSPALGYILGLRERITTEVRKGDKRDQKSIAADKAEIATVLKHECNRFADTKLKVRTRTSGPKDIFAIVSPSYSPADAPEVLDQLEYGLPDDAKASFSYDPTSTSWELRAEVWTPTPVAEQAVGEPFEGYVAFSSRDDGTSRFRGGGGVTLIRCLNASTYVAADSEMGRIHRGKILVDIEKMLTGSLKAINVLCDAWGINQAKQVDAPTGMTLEDAIPGFYRHMLTSRQSDLVGVLAGRTEKRVQGLTQAFNSERRNPSSLVRSDLAQGWTKYIQGEDTATRREAEIAIGNWLVRPTTVGYSAP